MQSCSQYNKLISHLFILSLIRKNQNKMGRKSKNVIYPLNFFNNENTQLNFQDEEEDILTPQAQGNEERDKVFFNTF